MSLGGKPSKEGIMSKTDSVPCTTSSEAQKGLDAVLQQALTDDRFFSELQTDPKAALMRYGYPTHDAIVSKVSRIDFIGLRQVFRLDPTTSDPVPYC
jgi:hypothetical protein